MEQEELEALAATSPRHLPIVEGSSQVRSSFISMLSHELRTPLNALNGFLSIVLSEQVGELNERQREFLGYAYDSTEQLMMLVQDIILLSRADLQQLDLQCVNLALPDVIAPVLRDVGPAAAKAGVTLHNQVPEYFSRLWGDGALLEQVFINLLHNALKLTSAGDSITILARRVGTMAEISIKDSGHGLLLEDQSNTFGTIYQLEDASLVKHGGFGLGLSVARVIVEHHGGHLSLHSEPGHGSTVAFTIPLFQRQSSGRSSQEVEQ